MFEKLANLHEKCFPHKPWNANDFAELKKSGCEIIMSENGFAVWRNVAGECEIITIGVNPDVQRNGIASAMLAIIENDAKKHDVKKIFLEVSAQNTPAQKLYEKNDYKQIGIRPKYYDGVDAILMAKDL